FEVRMKHEFHELHREIWPTLKAEVEKTYTQAETV
ncbi:MAG: ABC transporter ATP-binding protein, partial [Bradyrhizobium sp.]